MTEDSRNRPPDVSSVGQTSSRESPGGEHPIPHSSSATRDTRDSSSAGLASEDQLLILIDMVARQQDGEAERRQKALRWVLENHGELQRNRSDRHLALTRIGGAVLFFLGGIALALNGFQEIGFFILGSAVALLGEMKEGSR